MATLDNVTADHESVAAWRERVLAKLDKHPYEPPPWLRNPHAQTCWSTFMRRRQPMAMRKERLETPDEDFLDIYHVEGDADKPIVILMHGLEGNAESRYIVGMARNLKALGWGSTAVEFRTCGGEINRAPRTYHIGETSDLELVIETLIARYPDRRIYISGVSLGGNVTMKYLGEKGEDVPAQIRGGAAVSCPFDLMASGPHMDNAFYGLYLLYFIPSLRKKALAKAEQYPELLDVDKIQRAKTFYEFDSFATAPMHGFDDAHDYWKKNSCGQFLPHIRRPALLLVSADDPFNPGHTLPHEAVARNPYLVPQFTEYGGHVGFVYGASPLRQRFWAEEQVVRFFETIDADGP